MTQQTALFLDFIHLSPLRSSANSYFAVSLPQISAGETLRTAIPCCTAMAAAVPAAHPVATQIGIALKLECAICVPEIFLPASSKPSIFSGTRHPYGIVYSFA